MTSAQFSPLELFAIALAVTLGVGLLAVWRENTWHSRLETLRSEFGRELRRRDEEIQRLNSRLDTYLELLGQEHDRRAAAVEIHGDATIGGDAVGRDKANR